MDAEAEMLSLEANVSIGGSGLATGCCGGFAERVEVGGRLENGFANLPLVLTLVEKGLVLAEGVVPLD